MTLTLTASQRQTLADAKKVRAAIRKASKRERPTPKATRGRETDKGFLAYLRRQPCEARGKGGCAGRIDPAHIRFNDGPERQNPGAGRKNHDRHCNPLCRAHHDEQHRMSERLFWNLLGKDAYETAAAHYAAFTKPLASSEPQGTEAYSPPNEAQRRTPNPSGVSK